MLFAFGPEDLKRFAIPIGMGLAVVLILVIPTLRRSVLNAFTKGHEEGHQLRKKTRQTMDQ